MEDEDWKTNRTRKREPKFGRFWCGRCDAELVEAGKKCPWCGNKDTKPKRDKPGSR